MRALLVVLLFARLTFVETTVDARDGVVCDVYRVGATEVNVCNVEGGQP